MFKKDNSEFSIKTKIIKTQLQSNYQIPTYILSRLGTSLNGGFGIDPTEIKNSELLLNDLGPRNTSEAILCLIIVNINNLIFYFIKQSSLVDKNRQAVKDYISCIKKLERILNEQMKLLTILRKI